MYRFTFLMNRISPKIVENVVTSKKTWLIVLYSVQCIFCHFLQHGNCRGICRGVQVVCDEVTCVKVAVCSEVTCVKVAVCSEVNCVKVAVCSEVNCVKVAVSIEVTYVKVAVCSEVTCVKVAVCSEVTYVKSQILSLPTTGRFHKFLKQTVFIFAI